MLPAFMALQTVGNHDVFCTPDTYLCTIIYNHDTRPTRCDTDRYLYPMETFRLLETSDMAFTLHHHLFRHVVYF